MQKKPQKRSKSNQRVLMERLQRARLKPRAWAVALALEGYARIERDTGKRISSLYHQKIAAITTMSVENVRRALGELTKGPHPIYRKRNATGAQHTIYGNNDFELTTTGAIYEWIEDAPGDRAATATPLQAAALPHCEPSSRRGYKPTVRCLTLSQTEQLATDMVDDPDYGTMLPDGEKRIAEYYALRRHIEGCHHCEEAVARHIGDRHDRCGCGTLVVRDHDQVFDFWDFVKGDRGFKHRCDTSATANVGAGGDRP